MTEITVIKEVSTIEVRQTNNIVEVTQPNSAVAEVRQVNNVVEVQQTNNAVSVTSAGPQGPPGPQGIPGTPGGAAYDFTQSVPSATWVINHNMGRKVHVSLFDVGGNVVLSDIEHGTLNQATVTWSSPTTGTAVVS